MEIVTSRGVLNGTKITIIAVACIGTNNDPQNQYQSAHHTKHSISNFNVRID